jgi:hypothetical protein
MSIEMHVLFAGKLPSKAKLARKMKELGFPFSIVPPLGSLEEQEGYMPMRFRGDETGVEFDVFEEREDLAEIAGADLAQKYERSANFRWGGNQTEMVCGMCACAALAALVDGVVLDEFSDAPLSADEAIEAARKELAALPPPETTRRRDPGTRPADIRRYLKPLLKVRDDLVLIDRWLMVRPVRHLLRGVYFERAGDPSLFYLRRTIKPLYVSSGSWLGVGNRFGAAAWRVYEPYFQALLEAELAQEAFEPLGKITTISDFRAYLEADWDGRDEAETCIVTMLLCGESERAARCLEQLKEDRARSTESQYQDLRERKARGEALESYDLWMRELERVRREGDSYYLRMRALFDSFTRDVETFCAECHAREASIAKELKLDGIWEPSPFPIELPAAEQRRAAEALFSTTPWIAERPSPLMDLPAAPGEVRFAIGVGRREGRLILIAPLTRQEAEERHHRSEKYVLAVRLPNGLDFVFQRELCVDPNHPWSQSALTRLSEDQLRRIKLWIALQSGPLLASVSAYPPLDGRDAVFALSSVDVMDWTTRSSWGRHLVLPGDRLWRGDGVAVKAAPASAIYGNFVLTAAQSELIIFPPPAFGQYADLPACLQTALRLIGYGELR